MDLVTFRDRFSAQVRDARLIAGQMQKATRMSEGFVGDSRAKLMESRTLLDEPGLDTPAINYDDRIQSLLARAGQAREAAGAAQDREMKHMWTQIAESCHELAQLLRGMEEEKKAAER